MVSADAITLNVKISRRQRSSYPKSFKAQVVQECLQPGATISGVAIRHGINANVIRKWMPLNRHQPPAVLPAFIPVKSTPKRPAEMSAVIDLAFGDQSAQHTSCTFGAARASTCMRGQAARQWAEPQGNWRPPWPPQHIGDNDVHQG